MTSTPYKFLVLFVRNSSTNLYSYIPFYFLSQHQLYLLLLPVEYVSPVYRMLRQRYWDTNNLIRLPPTFIFIVHLH